jgi:polyvinyl alcohol dehydrogenase (cytochrome)
LGTGNNYSVPAGVESCEAQAIANNDMGADCTDSNDYFDTAMALELTTGKLRWANTRRIRWSKRAQDFDVWTVACLMNPANCPSPHGPDYDFGGAGPNFLGNMVGFGEKSGVYWAFNPDNGNVLWSTTVGPGGTLGGIEWGTATDGQRIYAAISNNGHASYTLVPSGQTITWGAWSALDATSGTLLWQTPDPNPAAIDASAVSVANGVVYTSSLSAACSNDVCDKNMFALDAASGNIL